MRLPWSPIAGVTLPEPLDRPASRLPSTTTDDPRLAGLAGHALTPGRWPRLAIIGFPTDEGVRRNCGRVGACEAPDRIRELFYRLTPPADARFVECVGHLLDLGNLRIGDDLESAQERLARLVSTCLDRGTLPIVLGGGHETAFGHFRGYANARRRVAIVNWDAHPDVRPLVNGQGHSGSPFRQALLDPSGACAQYTVAGLLPHSVATAHLEFLAQHGAGIVWRDEISRDRIAAIYAHAGQPARQAPLPAAEGPVNVPVNVMVSFDLDAVDQAFAPGVSAPACGGLPQDVWLEAALQAGRAPQVTSIDLVELNPRYDESNRSARLAALTIWMFLRGVTERGTGGSELGARDGDWGLGTGQNQPARTGQP